MVRAFIALARTQCLHQFRNGKCANSCCATLASLGSAGTFPGLAGCASAAPAVSCSKPVNNLIPPVPDFVVADASAFSRYTPPARSNSIRLPVDSLSVVPLVLRNAMILPLSHICLHRDERPLQSSILGRNVKVTCHVDTVSGAQANRRVASRRQLMSCG